MRLGRADRSSDSAAVGLLAEGAELAHVLTNKGGMWPWPPGPQDVSDPPGHSSAQAGLLALLRLHLHMTLS